MQKLIYVADDDANIRSLIREFLVKDGHAVEVFPTGDGLLAEFNKRPCDLVILDVMMPGSDGFAVCAALRRMSAVPIIMLTARDAEADYVAGITLGSDDYFTKPVSPMMLVMRVRAIFRRIEMEKEQQGRTPVISIGGVAIDTAAKAAAYVGQGIALTPNEYSLLVYLAENRNRAVSRAELLERIWGYSEAVETRVADDTVKRLRKKLSGTDVLVDTVWGYGFKLNVAED